jgi:hypothetical protein
MNVDGPLELMYLLYVMTVGQIMALDSIYEAMRPSMGIIANIHKYDYDSESLQRK